MLSARGRARAASAVRTWPSWKRRWRSGADTGNFRVFQQSVGCCKGHCRAAKSRNCSTGANCKDVRSIVTVLLHLHCMLTPAPDCLQAAICSEAHPGRVSVMWLFQCQTASHSSTCSECKHSITLLDQVPQGSAWHTGDLISCQDCSSRLNSPSRRHVAATRLSKASLSCP